MREWPSSSENICNCVYCSGLKYLNLCLFTISKREILSQTIMSEWWIDILLQFEKNNNCTFQKYFSLLSFPLCCLGIRSDFFFTHLAVSTHLRNNTFRVYLKLKVPHDGSTLTKNVNHCCWPPVETAWSREGSGCSLEPPAPEAVQSGRGGGGETSGADESEEDSDGPLQHAFGQRAAGGVSAHSKLFIHIKTFIITSRIIIVTLLYSTCIADVTECLTYKASRQFISLWAKRIKF